MSNEKRSASHRRPRPRIQGLLRSAAGAFRGGRHADERRARIFQHDAQGSGRMACRGAGHILRPEGADAEARALRGVQADAQADARSFPRADAAYHRALPRYGLPRLFARRRRGRRLHRVDREGLRGVGLGGEDTLGGQGPVPGDRRRNLRHPSVARRDGLHALRRRELPRKVRLRAAVYGGLPRAARGLRRQHPRRAGHRGEDGARPRRQVRTARGYLRKPRKRPEGAAR